MKFAEAFRVAVSPVEGFGTESDRVEQTTESDEHLFATDTGVHTTRIVKRVPDTEQRRADLAKSLQGSPWDRLPGRPAGRPRKTVLPSTARCDTSSCQASERPSEDASERSSAKVQDIAPPVVPRVIPVLRAADMENEPLMRIQPVTITRRSDRRPRLRAVQMTERIRVTNGVCNQRVSLNSRKAT